MVGKVVPVSAMARTRGRSQWESGNLSLGSVCLCQGASLPKSLLFSGLISFQRGYQNSSVRILPASKSSDSAPITLNLLIDKVEGCFVPEDKRTGALSLNYARCPFSCSEVRSAGLTFERSAGMAPRRSSGPQPSFHR